MIDLFQVRKTKNELVEAESLILTLENEISALKELLDALKKRKPLLYTIFFDNKEESLMIVADSFRSYEGYRFFLNDRCVAYFEEIQGFTTGFLTEEVEE